MAEHEHSILSPEEIQASQELAQALEKAFIAPLTPEIFNPETIMLALDLDEIDDPDRLAGSKMRPNSPKHKATREALGQARFDAYVAWSEQASQDQPQLVNKKTGAVSGARNRGLMQFCAGLVSVALGVSTPEDFCEETNARLAKTLGRRSPQPDNLPAYGRFKETTASVPEGSLSRAWQFLVSHD